jgi:O-antigen biosynthesis protein WbqP|tara:strand:+ start:36 stop:596 length:561 start_codon:yes stop_codon:yes gene_type:complete
MNRLLDITLSLTFFIVSPPLILLISAAIKTSSKGTILYWSERVGQGDETFLMPKFRTMLKDTPQTATHLLGDPNQHLTPIGNFLRKSSLDELPQFFSVLKGDMSLVGPRPALFNQYDLRELRVLKNIDDLKPGITGWAQVNGRDQNSITEKVELDKEYYEMRSFSFDLHIIYLTLLKVIKKDGVSH